MAGGPFAVFDVKFKTLLGQYAKQEVIFQKDYAFAHEAGIFLADTLELIVTSNRLYDDAGQQRVEVSKISLGKDCNSTARCTVLETPSIAMANGGVNYTAGSFLLCAQGSGTSPSGLFEVSMTAPHKATLLIDGFFGRNFNSVNDVIVHSDGSIWFTDPIYGYEQGYRPAPELPNQIYRFDPTDRSIRVVADGFGRPNGICFSPDEKTVYITDTDQVHGDGTIDGHRVSTIYAMDMIERFGGQFLTNRRVFAMADVGIPDGIKCDLEGNVYSGCGDGVNVWSPAGKLLGKILVDGGVANFCFGRPGEMYMLNETKVIRASLAKTVRGALLRL